MSLTESKVIDKIEIVEDAVVQVREATRILRDGQEIAKTYRRWSFSPASDVSSMPADVVAVCNAVWTPEVIAAYRTKFAPHKATGA